MDSHKPLTAGEIGELKALEAKATPGPWAWECTGEDNTCAVGTVMDENDNFVTGMVDGDADTVVVDSVCPEVSNHQDAAFIAAARNALPRLLSLLTPPTDAAVREAVERLNASLANDFRYDGDGDDLRTLLRAVQSPRMTGEQKRALKNGVAFFDNYARMKCSEQARVLAAEQRAAFPEAFAGEVGRG